MCDLQEHVHVSNMFQNYNKRIMSYLGQIRDFPLLSGQIQIIWHIIVPGYGNPELWSASKKHWIRLELETPQRAFAEEKKIICCFGAGTPF